MLPNRSSSSSLFEIRSGHEINGFVHYLQEFPFLLTIFTLFARAGTLRRFVLRARSRPRRQWLEPTDTNFGVEKNPTEKYFRLAKKNILDFFLISKIDFWKFPVKFREIEIFDGKSKFRCKIEISILIENHNENPEKRHILLADFERV